jgi:hypothetical protein
MALTLRIRSFTVRTWLLTPLMTAAAEMRIMTGQELPLAEHL